MNGLFALLELLHYHLHTIWYLLVIIEEHLLADNFIDKEASGLVGPLVLVEISRRFGQQLLNAIEQLVDTKLVQSRNGHYLCLGKNLVPFVKLGLKFGGIAQVNLVYYHDDGHVHVLNLLDKVTILIGSFYHISDIKQYIGILKSRNRELKHLLLQLVVGLQNTGGVGEAYLHLGGIQYAHDAMTSGLSLERSYADTLANQEIHQRRFAHIGIAYNVDKTCLVYLFWSFHVSVSNCIIVCCFSL